MTSPTLAFRTHSILWKQPTFIASLISVGLHGLVFVILSQQTPGTFDERREEELQNIEVVELSPDELQRLPDFAQPNPPTADPFATSMEPLPPLNSLSNLARDLDALAELGANAIAEAPPPLPPMPQQYNWSTWLPPAPQTLPPPAPLPPIQNNPIPTTPLAPLPQPNTSSDPSPRANPSPPSATPTPATSSPPLSTSAADLLGANPVDPTDAPPPVTPAPATPAPPQISAAERERYQRYSVGAVEQGAALAALSQWMASKSEAPFYGKSDLTLAFPDNICPRDAGAAWVAVQVDRSGQALEAEVVMETGYAALDDHARFYLRRLDHPKPPEGMGVYQYWVTYEDQGNCKEWISQG
ncbi:MAG: hypothetical protein VKJ85_13305 [Prochlorothrix sp.]|nr:hypothetical protein [Prochlorothrix sp.]